MDKVWMPKTAGILSMVAGAIYTFLLVIGGLFFFAVISGIAVGLGSPTNAPYYLIPIIGLPLLTFGVVAIIGGIAAIHRRNWRLALAGAICALFCVLLLGIPALIFVIAAKKEFI